MTGQGKFFKQVALVAGAFLSIISAASAAENSWRGVDLGMQEASKARKYILADVYTDWCGWCKRLDRDTFSDPELMHFLSEKFVLVKANAEDGGAGQKLKNDYGVEGYPCALVFDPDGKLIGRIVGFKDAQGYQSALRNIIEHPNQ